jgi:hypothetical protein
MEHTNNVPNSTATGVGDSFAINKHGVNINGVINECAKPPSNIGQEYGSAGERRMNVDRREASETKITAGCTGKSGILSQQ